MKGYQNKHSRHRIMPKEPKNMLYLFIHNKLVHIIIFVYIIHILPKKYKKLFTKNSYK